MNILEALRRGSQLLAQAGCEEASLEADLLLTHALALDRVHLYQRLRDELPLEQEAAYRTLLERRLNHEPTPYIIGRKEFYAIEFEVTPAAIIPRPETELLVELGLDFAGSRVKGQGSGICIVDVGAGCGAIAIALAANLPPSVQIIATDVSAKALALARRNARRHQVADRSRFLHGDLLEPLAAHPETVEGSPEPKPGGSRDSSRRVDVIAANLPYVRTADWERLPPESRDHEPRSGLDGGPDGLRVIERLLRQAPPYLKPGGALFVEIGDEQGPAASLIAIVAFPQARVEVKPDLAGLDRVLVVQDVQ